MFNLYKFFQKIFVFGEKYVISNQFFLFSICILRSTFKMNYLSFHNAFLISMYLRPKSYFSNHLKLVKDCTPGDNFNEKLNCFLQKKLCSQKIKFKILSIKSLSISQQQNVYQKVEQFLNKKKIFLNNCNGVHLLSR